MATYALTQNEWESIAREVVIIQEQEPDLRQYIPTKPTNLANTYSWTQAVDRMSCYVYEIGQNPETQGEPAGFTKKSVLGYGVIDKWEIPVDTITMARTSGLGYYEVMDFLKTRQTQQMIENILINGVSPGKYMKVGQATNDNKLGGLWNAVSVKSSTSATPVDVAPGFYTVVTDMISQVDTIHKPPYILVVHNDLWKYLYKVNATYSTLETKQLRMIEDAIGVGNGGAVVRSAHMPAPSNSAGTNGTLLLFKAIPQVLDLLEAKPITIERDPYVPSTKKQTGLIEWQGTFRIKDATGICKHADVDGAT